MDNLKQQRLAIYGITGLTIGLMVYHQFQKTNVYTNSGDVFSIISRKENKRYCIGKKKLYYYHYNKYERNHQLHAVVALLHLGASSMNIIAFIDGIVMKMLDTPQQYQWNNPTKDVLSEYKCKWNNIEDYIGKQYNYYGIRKMFNNYLQNQYNDYLKVQKIRSKKELNVINKRCMSSIIELYTYSSNGNDFVLLTQMLPYINILYVVMGVPQIIKKQNQSIYHLGRNICKNHEFVDQGNKLKVYHVLLHCLEMKVYSLLSQIEGLEQSLSQNKSYDSETIAIKNKLKTSHVLATTSNDESITAELKKKSKTDELDEEKEGDDASPDDAESPFQSGYISYFQISIFSYYSIIIFVTAMLFADDDDLTISWMAFLLFLAVQLIVNIYKYNNNDSKKSGD